MKILHINASYKPAYIYGGPTMSVSKLCETLIKAGHQVQVFTTTANGPDELDVPTNKYITVDGVPVHYFKRITKDHSHFSPDLLLAVWRQVNQFDMVHIHAWWNLVSVLSCLIAIFRGMPVVVSPRGTLSNYSFHNKNSLVKKSIHHFLSKPLLKQTNIHVTTAYEKRRVDELITPKRVFTIPNFIKLPANAPIENLNFDGTIKLLFFSRIEEKKGLDILIMALKSISIPYHLTIAGDGNPDYVNSLKILAQQHQLSGHISWIGFQGDDKFRIFTAHDLLVLPSYDESFGNVVIESLYVGTAVLVSEKVGLASYVQENKLGWICRTEPSSIADTINNIGPKFLTEIKNNAPVIIRRDFDEQNLVQKYTGMYTQILNNG